MKQWEIEYRQKLNIELSKGSYKIEGPPVLRTGKQGYIEFLVALRKQADKYIESLSEPEKNKLV